MVEASRFLSRRKLLFVLAGAGSVAAAAMLSPFRAILIQKVRELERGPTLRRAPLSLAYAGYDDWLDQVGAVFSIGGGTSMKLAGVQPFSAIGPRPIMLPRDRAFMAVFDVQNGRTMAGELIYTAVHPRYGALQIFLSASADPRTPGRMTAVFN